MTCDHNVVTTCNALPQRACETVSHTSLLQEVAARHSIAWKLMNDPTCNTCKLMQRLAGLPPCAPRQAGNPYQDGRKLDDSWLEAKGRKVRQRVLNQVKAYGTAACNA